MFDISLSWCRVKRFHDRYCLVVPVEQLVHIHIQQLGSAEVEHVGDLRADPTDVARLDGYPSKKEP